MQIGRTLPLVVLCAICSFTAQHKPVGATVGDTTYTIDLQALKKTKALPRTKVVVSNDDPVYHKTKRYNAFALRPFLEKHWDFESVNAAETKIVFECEDGYKPAMPLEKFLSVNSFLAVSDADAPKGSSWEKVFKNGNEIITAPFLVFYDEGVLPNDRSFKRPYNLTKIYLQPVTVDELPLPTEQKAVAGHQLFNKHCKTCHAINAIGGTMGPELNYPKSVTEYWKTDELAAFIVNPSAFRNKVKMPTLGISIEQSQEIMRYLEYVAKLKE